ncbi:MAG: metallophosphoesterase [Bacteroidales bacterium]|nr:metallophosphoesterase [Bacteroidales bacterium]
MYITRFFSKFAVLFVLLITTKTVILPGQQPVTFALLTDLHVNPASSSDTSLHLMVDEINQTKVDFTVVTGDLTNTGSDAELLAVKKALDKLIKPCYVLPGNHETNWSESAGLTFNRLWGNDRFLLDFNGNLFVGFNTGPFMKMGDGHAKQEDLLWLKLLQNSVSSHKLMQTRPSTNFATGISRRTMPALFCQNFLR